MYSCLFNMSTHFSYALLWVAIETGFLHGIDGVPQKFMGIFLASEAKMSGNFCGRHKSMFRFVLI